MDLQYKIWFLKCGMSKLQKATVYGKLFDRYASVIEKQHQCVSQCGGVADVEFPII